MDSIESIKTAMATDPRDWSENSTDAWLYGIIWGWGEALDEVAAKHPWTPDTLGRLRAMHKEVEGVTASHHNEAE